MALSNPHKTTKNHKNLVENLNRFFISYILALKECRRDEIKNRYFYQGQLIKKSKNEQEKLLAQIDEIPFPVVELSNLDGLYK